MGEKGIDAVAAGMWSLICDDAEHDWEWLLKNDPGVATELRTRARIAILRGGLVQGDPPESAKSPSMDLRFKEAFVNGSGGGDK